MSWRRLADAVVEALAPITFQAVVTGDSVRARQAAPRAVPAGRARSASTPRSAWRSRTRRPGSQSAGAAGCVVVAVPNLVADRAGARPDHRRRRLKDVRLDDLGA